MTREQLVELIDLLDITEHWLEFSDTDRESMTELKHAALELLDWFDSK